MKILSNNENILLLTKKEVSLRLLGELKNNHFNENENKSTY